jgi:hypothetical protein
MFSPSLHSRPGSGGHDERDEESRVLSGRVLSPAQVCQTQDQHDGDAALHGPGESLPGRVAERSIPSAHSAVGGLRQLNHVVNAREIPSTPY